MVLPSLTLLASVLQRGCDLSCHHQDERARIATA